MSVLARILLTTIIALTAVVATTVALDWRLWHRYINQPDDVADPANALWFSPSVKFSDGAGAELAVADTDKLVLPSAALEAAWTYAKSMDTDALIIAHNGVIQFERYATGIDQATLFQSQSLHKGLTAVALGAAIHSGAIESADVKASDYLAEWSDSPQGGQATLADLAYMQAGLERPRYKNHPFSLGLQLFLSGNVTKRALSTPFVAEPGQTFIWSNASTLSLSIAIERAVGKPWADFINETLWSPMGGGEAYVQLDRPGGTAFTSCCLVTNARNWLRVGQLLLNKGVVNEQRLLPEGWVERMTTGSASNANYGMQLWLNEPYAPTVLRNGLPRLELPRGERLLASDAFYVEGHFAQRLHVVPSAGLVVVRLGADRRDWDDAKLMNGLILAAQSHAAEVPLTPLPPPVVSFDEEPKATVPDYSLQALWASYPSASDASTNAFYVNPTTFPGPTWNADANDRDTRLGVDAVVKGQASVLNDCCAVYAPYYRQAGSAAVFDRTGSGTKAYELAFQDVRAAFDQFLAVSDDKPFVLMGHSQGAFHVQRLLSEVIIPRDLQDRLVVAYIVGISLPEDLITSEWKPLTPCATAAQVSCVMNWATFGPGADAVAHEQAIARRFPSYANEDGGIDLACTNPLTGSATSADAAANKGAVPLPVPGAYLSGPISGLVGAYCDGGLLRLSETPGKPFEAMVFFGENYHFYDVALFHKNLSEDVVRRATAFSSRAD